MGGERAPPPDDDFYESFVKNTLDSHAAQREEWATYTRKLLDTINRLTAELAKCRAEARKKP